MTAREIAEIDLYLKVTCFPDGVTGQNLEQFLTGDGKLDLLFEECDNLDVKVQLREAAKRLSIPVLMATSNRGMLDVERFDLEPDRPLFHGLAGDLDANVLTGLTVDEKVPWVLRIIGEENLSDRLRASLLEIDQTVGSWPQLGSAVIHGGAAVADVARRINLGQCRESGRFFVDVEQVIPNSTLPVPSIADEPAAEAPLEPGRMWTMIEAAEADAIDSERLIPSREEVAAMVSEAICAPSGGNCQPWRWVSRNGFLYLLLDRGRANSLADFGGLGAMVALGAAAEIIPLAAHHLGFEVRIEILAVDDDCNPVVRFSFFPAPNQRTERHEFDALYPLIGTRYTDRGNSNRKPLDDEAVTTVSEAVLSVPGIQLQILQDEDALHGLAHLLGAADRLPF